MSEHHHHYTGSPDQPLPPVEEDGWSCVDSPDHLHFELAQGYAASGQIGQLPVNHYTDLQTPTGLYRFFHFDSPAGGQIGALHYDGQIHRHDYDQLGLIGDGASADGVTQLSSAGGGLSDGNGNAYSLGGASGHEPIPQSDSKCKWVPDATNSAAVTMANNISYHNTPVPFTDQSVYNVTIAGVAWRMVMWAGDCVGDGGTYHCVSTFRCEPQSGPAPGPTPPASSSSSMGVVFGILAAAVLGVGGAVALSKKKHAHA